MIDFLLYIGLMVLFTIGVAFYMPAINDLTPQTCFDTFNVVNYTTNYDFKIIDFNIKECNGFQYIENGFLVIKNELCPKTKLLDQYLKATKSANVIQSKGDNNEYYYQFIYTKNETSMKIKMDKKGQSSFVFKPERMINVTINSNNLQNLLKEVSVDFDFSSKKNMCTCILNTTSLPYFYDLTQCKNNDDNICIFDQEKQLNYAHQIKSQTLGNTPDNFGAYSFISPGILYISKNMYDFTISSVETNKTSETYIQKCAEPPISSIIFIGSLYTTYFILRLIMIVWRKFILCLGQDRMCSCFECGKKCLCFNNVYDKRNRTWFLLFFLYREIPNDKTEEMVPLKNGYVDNQGFVDNQDGSYRFQKP